LRVTPEAKARLDAAAKHSGRSQSQEAEFRLEQSFDYRGLRDGLSNVFGAELAGLVMMVGLAMLNATLHQYWTQSDFLEGDDKLTGWADDPTAYDQGVQAANLILEAYRPSGEVLKPNNPPSEKVVKDLILAAIAKGNKRRGRWHDPGEMVDVIDKLIRAHRLEERAREIGILPAKQETGQ